MNTTKTYIFKTHIFLSLAFLAMLAHAYPIESKGPTEPAEIFSHFHTIPVSYKGRFQPMSSYAKQWAVENINDKTTDTKTTDLDLLWYAMILGTPNKITNDENSNEKNLWPEEIDFQEDFQNLKTNHYSPKEISQLLEMKHPISLRLAKSSSLIKALPSRYNPGEWFSLKALKAQIYDSNEGILVPVGNFTLFPNDLFGSIQKKYFDLERSLKLFLDSNDPIKKKSLKLHIIALSNNLAVLLQEGYQPLAGKPFLYAAETQLNYPTRFQLIAEHYYHNLPLLQITITIYALSLVSIILSQYFPNNKWKLTAYILLTMAFISHTIVLGLRSYILQRPPVSNMFETLLYVPWITIILAFLFDRIYKHKLILIAGCTATLILLTLLQTTHLHDQLENVQAVLNSQYWLVVHVLMIVASYGVFILCGLLGHFYLIKYILNTKQNKKAAHLTKNSTHLHKNETHLNKNTTHLQLLGKGILQSMYVGSALLIPGTILGGVWAAESWGRFWDWDPKESWAFISICVYLIWIHAFRFHKITYFGLAIGSIVGLQFITFTWYGVNYILGTGLHSYGFGSGGTTYYYLFILMETIFLGYVITKSHFFINRQKKFSHSP